MKKGDWVIHKGSGKLGRITVTNFNHGYHLVDYQDNTFARLTFNQYLKPVAKPVSDILTAVNTQESEK